MNVSLRWLRALAPGLHGDARSLADRLAMLGAPVEAVTEIGAALGDIRIARVLEVRKHPNADRLSLCTVDAGRGQPLPVVCGAPNVKAGALYPYAPVGAHLPGGLRIEERKIRGEVSRGMLCSARELELGRDHEGILELHGEFEIGAPFAEAIGLADVRLEVEVTPNRGDLLCHFGVARELAPGGVDGLVLPAFGGGVALAELDFAEAAGAIDADGASVRVEDDAACPHYTAVIMRGLRVGPSPEWLASRLRAVGQRPINNVVDATNYVLQELGQPMHAFDLARLEGGIVVRAARAGETLRTLDGVDRRLDAGLLVIADSVRPVALAGVMGGEATEVGLETRDILLETAIFDPVAVRRTRRGLGMTTDASYRFERGVDPDGVERAVRRAVALIVATAGGSPDARVASVRAKPFQRPVITLRVARVRQVLGIELSPGQVGGLLDLIGFDVLDHQDGTLGVHVPGHRSHDTTREDDLVEEVARRYGYDSFPDEQRPFRSSSVPDDPRFRLEDELRTLMAGAGLLEARNTPFAPDAEGDIALMLPLSAAESRLRRDIVPGLLHRTEANHNRGARDVRLFEIGTAFRAPSADDTVAAESTRLAVVLTGARAPVHWSDPAGDIEIWDLKGVLESTAARIGGRVVPWATEPMPPSAEPDGSTAQPLADAAAARRAYAPVATPPTPGQHPLADPTPAWLDARQAFRVRVGDNVVGYGGRVRAGVVDAPAWAGRHFAFELRIDTIAPLALPSYAPLPAHPAVERDVALVVPHEVSAATIEATIRDAAGALLERVAPFDVFRGEGVPADARSIAFRLRFRALDRTLTDDEVDAILDRVLHHLRERHQVERRG